MDTETESIVPAVQVCIKFNLDTSEGRHAFRQASNAGGAHSVLWDLDNWLRNQIKHGPDKDLHSGTLEKVRDELHSYTNDQHVDIDGCYAEGC